MSEQEIDYKIMFADFSRFKDAFDQYSSDYLPSNASREIMVTIHELVSSLKDLRNYI